MYSHAIIGYKKVYLIELRIENKPLLRKSLHAVPVITGVGVGTCSLSLGGDAFIVVAVM